MKSFEDLAQMMNEHDALTKENHVLRVVLGSLLHGMGGEVSVPLVQFREAEPDIEWKYDEFEEMFSLRLRA